MSNEAHYSPRDLLVEHLTEKFGDRVDAVDGYRPYTAAIGLDLNDIYVLPSRGELFISTKYWVKVGHMGDPNILGYLDDFIEGLVETSSLDLSWALRAISGRGNPRPRSWRSTQGAYRSWA